MLSLVTTPLGNLEDCSARAIRTLQSADIIACEDPLKSMRLLNHFGIKKPLCAFHSHNERKMAPKLLERVANGEEVAVITEAGVPGISDPGYSLVRGAIDQELPFTLIPGGSALIMALVLSGLPAHAFTFRGFPPRTSGKRQHFFEVDVESPHTLIFYESPHRLIDFLQDALTVFGDRPAAVAHELTKLHESVTRGTLLELTQLFPTMTIQGEYVVVIAGKNG